MAIAIIQQYVRISTGFLFLSTIQRTETSKLVFPDSLTSSLFLVRFCLLETLVGDWNVGEREKPFSYLCGGM